jgi:hypothetical protein
MAPIIYRGPGGGMPPRLLPADPGAAKWGKVDHEIAARGIAATLAGMLAVSVASAGLARAESLEGSAALLQGLDKVTARISSVTAPIGKPVRFGTLEITIQRCVKHPPEEPPESAALLEIREVRPGEPPVAIFRGWMFASSPALSALEHPVYDIWVKDCLNARSPAPSEPR